MVIVDYSGTVISVLYASHLMDMFDANRKEEPDINLVRHAVLNTLRSYKKMFKQKGSGGEMIIAADAGRSWRKDHFKHYKENRKKNRDKSPTDWNSVFVMMNQILSEIDEFTPLKTMKVQGAEADDIISVLIEKHAEKYSEFGVNESQSSHSLFDTASDLHSNISFIVSEDKDFHQLQKFAGVQQFYPRKKTFFIDKDPRDSLMKKIIFGDAGDGVPNILSDDDTFVTEKRQRVINEKRFSLIEPWASKQIDVQESLYDSNIKEPDIDVVSGWCRNRKMIDLSFIPGSVKTKILQEYEDKKDSEKTASVMLDYLFEHRCKNLVSDIQDFFN